MPHVYIRTYGCQMNARDSEALAARLTARGFATAPDEASADIVILNTCSVRELAESKALGKAGLLGARRARDPKFLVGIMGCMAQNLGAELLEKVAGGVDFVVGTQQAHHIPDFLETLWSRETRGAPILALDAEAGSQDAVCDHVGAPPSAFVSIQQGCDMHCSYCIVPSTRGPERSRSMAGILAEVQKLAAAGTREITLLGQIVTSYARRIYPVVDGKTPFVQLLEAVSDVEGIERIRFTSPHPRGFGSDLIDAYARLPKLCPFVHLPVQSGSNAVLKAMKRPYTREAYLDIVRGLRAARPDIAFCTDIIVGFPSETERDFQDTLELFDAVKFGMAYIFKYSPRRGTPAAEMPGQIPVEEMERRNQLLLDRLAKYSLAESTRAVGTVQRVLVEAPARKGDGVFVGYNPQHRKTLFKGSADLVGKMVDVKIDRASVSALYGDIVA